jgi:hypothetical protein
MSEENLNNATEPRSVDQQQACSPAVKPPLGLKPRFIAAEHRLWEIIAAYQRFLEAGHAPRIEWAEELLDLTKYLASRKSSQANEKSPSAGATE